MSTREKVVRYVLLIVVLFITIGPFLWQLSTSLKGAGEDIYTANPSFIPSAADHRATTCKVAAAIPVWRYIGNSLLVAAIDVLGNIVFATLAGFALARLQWRLPEARARPVPRHPRAARRGDDHLPVRHRQGPRPRRQPGRRGPARHDRGAQRAADVQRVPADPRGDRPGRGDGRRERLAAAALHLAARRAGHHRRHRDLLVHRRVGRLPLAAHRAAVARRTSP